MWKVLCIWLLAAANFYALTNSAKLTENGQLSTDRSNEPQNNHPTKRPLRHEIGHSANKKQEVHELIGRWRSNGAAIEPKWRDGDSVPLVPFYTASFQNAWQNGNRFGEEAVTEPESFEQDDTLGSYSTNIKYFVSTQDTDAHSEAYKSSRKTYKNEPDSYELNLERFISSTEHYPIDKDYEHTHRNGYKNYDSRRSGSKYLRLTPDDVSDNDKEKFRDSGADPNVEENLQPGSDRNGQHRAKNRYSSSNGGQEEPYKEDSEKGSHSLFKYRETFQNRPNEYDLNEDEYERPRPRKRRPPQNYEFLEPTSLHPAAVHGQNESFGQSQSTKKTEARDAVPARSHRKPYPTRSTESRNEAPKGATENTDLKSLLKMHAEGLSLSEILQQRNLSLSDLLKGKPNAISVLKSTNQESESARDAPKIQETSETSAKVRATERPRWMPNPKLRTKNAQGKTSESSAIGIPQSPELSKNLPSMMKPDDGYVKDRNRKQPLDEEMLNTTHFAQIPEATSDDFTRVPTEYINNRKIISFDATGRRFMPNRNRTLAENVKRRFLKLVEDENANTETVEESSGNFEENRETMSETDDEDEIMEFSDFTVKKTQTTTTRHESTTEEPSEILRTDFGAMKKSSSFEDPDLLLSIEHILTSTERILATSESNSVGDSAKFKSDLESLQRNHQNLAVQDKTFEKPQLPNSSSNKENSTKDWNLFGISDSEHDNANVRRIVENNDKNRAESQNPSLNESNVSVASTKNLVSNTTKNHRLYEEIVSEVEPEARAEISELFSSGSSAKRLERLLNSRNMSIEELIALRQRGSSRVHLAEVFASKDKVLRSQKDEEKPKDVPLIEQSDHHDQQQSHTRKIEQSHDAPQNESSSDQNNNRYSRTHQPLTAVERIGMAKEQYERSKEVEESDSNSPTRFNYRRNGTKLKPVTEKSDRNATKSYNSTERNQQEMGEKSATEAASSKTTKNLGMLTTFDSLPFSKNIQRDSEGSSYWTSITEVRLPIGDKNQRKYNDPLRKAGNLTSIAEFGRVEEMLNDDQKSLSNVYESNDYGGKEKKTLSKVKPSIIASGAILGVTVVVFLAIFIACRIRQKQRFTYNNSFSKAVFSGPVMTARKLSNTSSLNTIMVNVVATSTTKRPQKSEDYDDETYESRSDIDNDSLDANDSWDTIPDFMK